MTPVRFEPGAEVTVTLAGKVIHHGAAGWLVVEYLNAGGFPDRTTLDPGALAVTVAQAPPPDAAEQARRDLVAQLIAEAGR